MSPLSPVKRLIGAVRRYATDPAYRGMVGLALRRPATLFQPYASARPGRYPTIFAKAREQLGDGPRILSFGCAVGDEVFTLRQYFPQATIKGLDINPSSIAQCERRLRAAPDRAIAFAVADGTRAEPDASYDAVFCMAVLRHGDLSRGDPQRCDHLIRFADFERIVADFARVLKPGGLLAIRHSNFRFKDCAAAADFDTLLNVHRYPDTPQFDAANRRLPDAAHESALFVKRR